VHMFRAQEAIHILLTMASLCAVLIVGLMASYPSAQDKTSPLVVRVATFAVEQGRLDDYRDFIEHHLFPTLRGVPGYVGTFLGRDPNSGQLISMSFWRSEADAVAGEQAVGRAIGALPQGSAPRPSNVAKFVIEYRDIKEPLTNKD
jgi:hypothetical protein